MITIRRIRNYQIYETTSLSHLAMNKNIIIIQLKILYIYIYTYNQQRSFGAASTMPSGPIANIASVSGKHGLSAT
jgi:hypothetical protein